MTHQSDLFELTSLLTFKDIIATAETGSGKTLAYALPICNRLIHIRKQHGMAVLKCTDGKFFHRLPALIVAPTRELATQV